MARREDIHLVLFSNNLTRERVQSIDSFNFIAEKFNTNSMLFVHRDDFDSIAPHSKGSTVKIHVVAGVLHIHELAQQVITIYLIPALKSDHLLHIFFGRTQTVNTRNSRDHNNIAASQKGICSRVPQAFYFFID